MVHSEDIEKQLRYQQIAITMYSSMQGSTKT